MPFCNLFMGRPSYLVISDLLTCTVYLWLIVTGATRLYIESRFKCHLCRHKNKLPIPAKNWRPVRKGRKIASHKSAFLYAFAIITINK